jgi:hypothetical protein
MLNQHWKRWKQRRNEYGQPIESGGNAPLPAVPSG